MAKTVIGLYNSEKEAKAAREALVNAKINPKEISVLAASDDGRFKELLSGGLKQAFAEAGIADQDGAIYLEGVRRGYVLVSAHVEDSHAQAVAKLMNDHGAISIDQVAAYWRSEGWDGRPVKDAKLYDRALMESDHKGYENYALRLKDGGTAAIPVIEEELRVGKREVESGGVRVETRVTETPVEEDVTLRQESVGVQRRAVNRPLTDADAKAAFKEGVIEVTATSEEAVVEKQARVVEEVMITKDVGQVTQTIQDSVRRTDVEVVEGVKSAAVQSDWTVYGTELAGNRAYAGRDWTTMEADVRRDWESRYGGGTSVWADVKDTIRGAWESAKRAVR